MRLSRLLAPTLKEAPREAETPSHKLLVRAGFVRQVAAGIYDFLPLGLRSLRKVERIVRDEMDAAGAQEILMPMVQPKELWEDSGRWAKYGTELLRFKDRKGSEFCLGPTHEEVVTDIVRREVRSYRDLPKNLYQIQAKFRDELRPRAGLMRGREFVMKDAYSFDVSDAAAKVSYQAMYEAYGRIFTRCGLDHRAVEADTGAIGGSLSHEFQVLADTGEDAIVACDHCDYAANVEQAELRPASPAAADAPPVGEVTEVHTPNAKTIAEVSAFLDLAPSSFIKTLVYTTAGGRFVMVLVRGDHGVNELKLAKAVGEAVHLAQDTDISKAVKAPIGFVGPVAMRTDIEVIADLQVMAIRDGATGANKKHHHLTGVNPGRDFTPTRVEDLRAAGGGDACARCDEGRYRKHRGIEVGHVFFLGTVYSEAMGATFRDEAGNDRPVVMGCYGIGISRIMAAAVEQHHDDKGIAWPMPVAPYEATILALDKKEGGAPTELAERLYGELVAGGMEVLFDDRDARPGFKFKDADLIGVPVRVAIGERGLAEGVVEVVLRRTGELARVPIDEAVAHVRAMVDAEHARHRP
jgi:prolyl-tRNA synthetase